MINLYPSAEPHPFVRDIDFYAGIGCGRICRAWDVFVTLSSWAVVDRAIARLGLLVDLASSRINIEVRIVPPRNTVAPADLIHGDRRAFLRDAETPGPSSPEKVRNQ